MKKLLALILATLLTLTCLIGCAGTTVVVGGCNHDEGEDNGGSTVVGSSCDCATNVNALKTGVSISTSISDSISATADKNGEAKYDVTVVAVLVDRNGVIVSCAIDSIPATVQFNATGNITSDTTAEVKTKYELGDAYGMVAWGGAKAEWDAQIDALEAYVKGKTVEQIKNGDINMTTGKPNPDSDLASSASIYLAGYVYAIEAAVNNAKNLGAKLGDELVLSTINTVKSSASATADKKGVAQLDSDIVALTRSKGVITSCYIDAVQAKIEFDATGAITTDLTAKINTKNELGDAYGMVAWGHAKYEWNEQAKTFAAYVTGKTAEEIAGISIAPSTKPLDGTDLATSVTIAIGGFQALLAKAMQ